MVTSVSQSLKDDTLRLFNIQKAIEVVPNFIDVDAHNNPYTECQRGLMAEDHERIITHISNLRPVKRVMDVIEVFDRIQQQIPARLLIVGEGPEKAACEELAKIKGLEDKIAFLGNSNEVNKILCFSDLFLLPSEKESFGLAALEAMACGVPVISSNTGGLLEVNRHGVSGYLSNVGDVEDMAIKGISILRDQQELEKFKANAKKEARRFDTELVVPLYEKVYEKAFKHVQLKP